MREAARRWWRRKLYDYLFWYFMGKSKEGRDVFHRELDAIADSVNGYINFQKTESEIISERLSRRFDLSAALNESAARAIKEKQAVIEHPLTDKQKAALEFQKSYLQKIVRNS